MPFHPRKLGLLPCPPKTECASAELLTKPRHGSGQSPLVRHRAKRSHRMPVRRQPHARPNEFPGWQIIASRRRLVEGPEIFLLPGFPLPPHRHVSPTFQCDRLPLPWAGKLIATGGSPLSYRRQCDLRCRCAGVSSTQA